MGRKTSFDRSGPSAPGTLPQLITLDHRRRRGQERDTIRLAARATYPSRVMLALATSLATMVAAANLPMVGIMGGNALRFAQASELMDRSHLDEPIDVMIETESDDAETAPASRPLALEQMPVEALPGVAEEVRRDPPRMRPAKLTTAAAAAAPMLALPYGADWLAAQTVMLENVDSPPRMQRNRGGRHLEIEYPKGARRAGIEGNVILGFVVDLDGRTKEVEILKPLHPLCDSAAVRALRTARFDPGHDNGKTVRVRAKLSILFQLIGY